MARRRFSRRGGRRHRGSKFPQRNTFVFILWAVILIQGFFLLKYFVASPGLTKDAFKGGSHYRRLAATGPKVAPAVMAPKVGPAMLPAQPKVTTPVSLPKPAPEVRLPKNVAPVAPAVPVPLPVPLPKPAPIPKPLPTPKIAIVLDDWGYSLKNVSYLDEIQQTLNISILPHLPYSEYIAKLSHNKRFEILLHMPMEPYKSEEFGLEKGTILTSMNESQIKGLLADAIKSVPYIRGVNNHMGSKATEDTQTMQVVLKELKRRHLFFLDSFTAHNPVSFSLAKDIRIRSARRDVFLDNEEDYEHIKNQLFSLAQVAKRQGFAVGIGHDRGQTLRALKDVLPVLEKKGFKFVRVSDLVK